MTLQSSPHSQAKVQLTLPYHRYDILIEPGSLRRLGAYVREVAPHSRAGLIADASVAASHMPLAALSLREAGYDIAAHSQPFGEENKNLATVAAIYDVLVSARMERRSPVIALGGGVVGDAVGFAAATYLRGVPFIQCPTTLLAMVDASVGGKVGVNLPQGKNLVGSFHQPHLVIIDTHTLRTLPAREFRCGLAECVKHAVIRDPALFDWIENNLAAIMKLDDAALVELVRSNVQIKANVVMADEKETGERAHLNFGHTFAHAIEAVHGYGAYLHGEAVSLGMIAATTLAMQAGRCDRSVLDRLRDLLRRIGLPVAASDLPHTEALIAAMGLDKKVADGQIRLILPDRMGAVSIVKNTPVQAIRDAWQAIR